jgi:2-succinyl-5-enolpyruvyl-6-hydroxy-3-cyclohexene-1-carboxylate synthase
MTNYYTDEINAQILIALLKLHNIKKIIASPGSTNIAFIGSIQNDPFFEIYSSVDERSAAYMACGLATETGVPVVISCTGATASRNYLSGLTEAYYRKLPILAITSTISVSNVGHHVAQVIDRSSLPNDVAKLSVTLPIVKDDNDFWDCEIKVNKAILELKRNGGGPVHINLPTTYSTSYVTEELPRVRKIDRITINSKFPEMPKGKIAIFIGSHSEMTKKQTEIIDLFCASNDAVVFCDHTSGYKGKYRVLYSLVAFQHMFDKTESLPDLLIHIGEISGDYYSKAMVGKEVWRINEDGEIRDTYKKLKYVFEMSEEYFFKHYTNETNKNKDNYLAICNNHLQAVYNKLPELPFSNVWFASKMAHLIPEGSTIHFAILNSLRSWNFFELPSSVSSASNVGGFGIDGCLSSLIGASLVNKDKLYYGIIGDLAFFYDMNVMGNRHVGNNLRILLVNNGKGTEFRQFSHAASHFEESADKFIAAAGHFGNKSPELVKHYAQDLGFEYMSAFNKEEFEKVYKRFLTPEITNRSMLFEVFTTNEDESDALEAMMNIEGNIKGKAKELTKQILGNKGMNVLRNVLRK